MNSIPERLQKNAAYLALGCDFAYLYCREIDKTGGAQLGLWSNFVVVLRRKTQWWERGQTIPVRTMA